MMRRETSTRLQYAYKLAEKVGWHISQQQGMFGVVISADPRSVSRLGVSIYRGERYEIHFPNTWEYPIKILRINESGSEEEEMTLDELIRTLERKSGSSKGAVGE